jgi:hypothetical protein
MCAVVGPTIHVFTFSHPKTAFLFHQWVLSSPHGALASEVVRPDTENLFLIAIIAVGHLIERNHKGHFNHASFRRLNAPMNKHNTGLPLEA